MPAPTPDDRVTDLGGGQLLVCEDSTEAHWVGWWRDVVLVVVHEQAHRDARHVEVGAALIERLVRETKRPVRLLAVASPGQTRPPEAQVRQALTNAARQLEGHVGRVAVVVLGTGFGPAIHRGVVAGVTALLRSRLALKVVGTVPEGLAYLREGGEPGAGDAPLDALARAAERLSRGAASS
ncbi:MAG: hypothetical protein FJ104_01145, partial [Deltaproteobacteria bacterium]|nr:hypothetical protein [Deltaproteobacteria bacterium]